MKLPLILYNMLYTGLYAPGAAAGYLLSKDKTAYSNRLGFSLPSQGFEKSIWFHAASVGEVRSLTSIVNEIKIRYPDIAVIVSTMTVNGLKTAKAELNPDAAFLLPVENRIAISKALKRYGTKVFIITDTEIWPNLITSIPETIQLIMLNGRISDKTYNSYLKYRRFVSPLLNRFNYIFTKSTLDTERFKSIAPDALVEIGANIKYIPAKKEITKEVAAIKGKIAFAASTHPDEELFFLKAVKICKNKFDKIVIAPRHIERAKKIVQLAKNEGFTASLFTAANNPSKNDKDVIIVDILGILEDFYQIADKIFVGGSVAKTGGHNIFEAMQYNKCVCTGANMQNFSELTPLAEKYGMLHYVKTEEELAQYFCCGSCTARFDELYTELHKEQETFRNAFYSLLDGILVK